jgi:hypothetical protein
LGWLVIGIGAFFFLLLILSLIGGIIAVIFDKFLDLFDFFVKIAGKIRETKDKK